MLIVKQMIWHFSLIQGNVNCKLGIIFYDKSVTF